jgi:hypothetical protein
VNSDSGTSFSRNDFNVDERSSSSLGSGLHRFELSQKKRTFISQRGFEREKGR